MCGPYGQEYWFWTCSSEKKCENYLCVVRLKLFDPLDKIGWYLPPAERSGHIELSTVKPVLLGHLRSWSNKYWYTSNSPCMDAKHNNSVARDGLQYCMSVNFMTFRFVVHQHCMEQSLIACMGDSLPIISRLRSTIRWRFVDEQHIMFLTRFFQVEELPHRFETGTRSFYELAVQKLCDRNACQHWAPSMECWIF